MEPSRKDERIDVWDLPVRLYHWLQLLGIATAAVTGVLLGALWINIHAAAGIFVLFLVIGRIIWGFTGSTYSRFSSFVPTPGRLSAYVRELQQGNHSAHLGHNPLGAAMILLLFAILIGLSVTGLLTWGGVFKTGPGAPFTSYMDGMGAREIHELLAFTLLVLIVLHIGGALFESWRSRENLPAAMVTGKKSPAFAAQPSPPKRPRPLAALAAAFAIFAPMTVAGWTLSQEPVAGAPVSQLSATYETECAACHMAYHPSLLPAASWNNLLDNLDSHFGEDASLDDATLNELRGWLSANAAENADTKPANIFRRTSAEAPYALTETPFWKRRHSEIPDSVFASRPVSNKANCVACHGDAETGWFHPGNIEAPKEAMK